jgi:hypothetical protein
MYNDLNTTDAPTQRILIIAETIARYGPITLAQLTERLQFSRGAIWRAVNTMRNQGWVRMRLGDNAYEMRSAFANMFAQCHHALAEIEMIEPLMTEMAKAGAVYVDLCHFTQLGECRVIETNRKELPTAALSLCDDDLAVAAQLQMPPKDLVAHLRAFITVANDEERRLVTSGEHGRHLARLRDTPVVWLDDQSAVSFPVQGHIGFALRAELWRTTKAEIAAFSAYMSNLITKHRAQNTTNPQFGAR